MPSRYLIRHFEPGHYYHLYNRGANKQNIFNDETDYHTFMEILSYYLRFPTGQPFSTSLLQGPTLINQPETSPLHQLTSYCLMPNHFHFLIKQTQPPTEYNNISNFMKRICVTYSMYFNQKHNHSGSLLQGKFKNVVVNSEPQLLYLTKYIHLNPNQPQKYPYSSYSYYLNPKQAPTWLHPDEILSMFSRTNPNLTYQSFVEDQEAIPSECKFLLLD